MSGNDKCNHKPFVLGLNGSPHRDRDTARSLVKALKRAEKCGAEIKFINLVDYGIFPCEGCSEHGCGVQASKERDIKELKSLILRAEAFILATSVCYKGRTPHTASFVAKMTSMERKSLLESKAGGLIITHETQDGGVGDGLMGAFSDMGVIFPPYGVVNRGRIAKTIDALGIIGELVSKLNPQLEDNLDGTTQRLEALGENIMKVIEMMRCHRGKWR